MKPSPIVFFVYNRPHHTRQTVDALAANDLAESSDFIIYADGPKSSNDLAAVKEVRDYIRKIHGFKQIDIIERSENWDLAKSIIAGVTEVVGAYGRVIVMEDDLITSPYFLRYMNEALEIYQDASEVMHIAGYTPPINPAHLPETFFYRAPSCWGWGTWRDAWRYFERDVDSVIKKFSPTRKKSLNLDGYHNFWSHLMANKTGKLETWAIFWYAAVLLNGGLCLHPAVSMVKNIGHDGSGANCRKSRQYGVSLAQKPIKYYEKNKVENIEALRHIQDFYKKIRPFLFSRMALEAKYAIDLFLAKYKVGKFRGY